MSRAAQTDVIIAGGGMVGASLAVALGSAGVRTTVVEAVPAGSGSQPSYDERTTALSWGSRRILETLGLWGSIGADATPILRIHVSDRGRLGMTRIEADEQGLPALGYVVPNRVMGAALFPALESAPSVQLISPAKVVAVETDTAGVRVRVEAGNGDVTVEARLLVVADGARSTVREALGISAETRTYGQTALIGTVTPGRAHRGTAYERFTDTGPIALLPLGSDRCTLVWTVDTDAAGPLVEAPPEEALATFQRRFGWRLGRFRALSALKAYPLAITLAERDTAPRAVVLGNAAHSLHPIAAQGFNLGLRDAAVLAELVVDALRDDADIGSHDLLEAYSLWRSTDQRRVSAFTDHLARVFANPTAVVGAARGLSMLALDILPGAKHRFAHHTMGRAGRQSRLVRGLPL